MNLLAPVLLALATAMLLLCLGYWLRGRWPTGMGVAASAAPPAWFSREEAVGQLRALRDELESGGEYGETQALLLFDCCASLGLDEGEIQAVIGPAWFDFIEEPADLDDLELEI